MSEKRKRFDHRVTLVTGAASGIGRATAMLFAEEGATVAVLDRNEEGGIETVRAIEAAGGKAGFSPCDVSHSAQVENAVKEIVKAYGPIDILANVAGIGDPGTIEGIETLEESMWDLVLAVNLKGPFLLSRAVLPTMAERGKGAIVNVSSLAGRSKSANGGPAYTASKAGLLGLTRHLAFNYGPKGVRVNAICPGGVDTPMIRGGGVRAAESETEAAARAERIAAYEYFMPIKRLSQPDEQAAAIAFLASDDASYINGISMDVNGGLFMA